ncbi:hypothetical protein N7510_002598 [Penicillium lagena]|uniref:uncharacterized protein n=1 Tax=Penicillium lagena TaxID=94218 RepID=UPI002540C56D|nr:uncharacterized protein N7510_002598 [Penicillium lagena]KAJ5626289.1 hypothetical protein N7510_002598 [Penicillium lagena]
MVADLMVGTNQYPAGSRFLSQEADWVELPSRSLIRGREAFACAESSAGEVTCILVNCRKFHAAGASSSEILFGAMTILGSSGSALTVA